MKSKKDRTILYFLIIVHIIFFVISLYYGNYYLDDSYEYFWQAKNILNDFIFYSNDLNESIDNRYYTKRPPLYSLFIIVSSIFLKWKIGVLIFQNIISVITILMTIKIFESLKFQINKKILLVFLATSLSQYIYANLLMSEIVFQFLIVSLLYQFTIVLKNKKMKSVLIFQMIIILLFLTKPVFYLFVIPNLVFGLFLVKRIKYLWLGALIPIIALIGFSYWNYTRTGSYEISSIQNINLKDYNLKYFHTNVYGAKKALEINEKITSEINEIKEYSNREKTTKKIAINYLKKDFLNYVLFHFKGSVRMLFDPGRFDLYNFFSAEKSNKVGFLKILNDEGYRGIWNYIKMQPLFILISLPIILFFNFIKIAGFIFFGIKNCTKLSYSLWFMVILLGYIIGLTGPLGASRFMVPILPIYLIIAVIGIESLLKNYLKKLYLKIQ